MGEEPGQEARTFSPSMSKMTGMFLREGLEDRGLTTRSHQEVRIRVFLIVKGAASMILRWGERAV